MKTIAIETWDPEFGASVTSPELEPSEAQVDVDVEMKSASWKPLTSSTPAATHLGFIDGVRRIEARVWISEDGQTSMGLCASYAAGIVEAGERATLGAIRVRRGLFTTGDAFDLDTDAGTFAGNVVVGDPMAGVQKRLRSLEIDVATQTSLRPNEALLVVDGPLSAEHESQAFVGFVKSHRVTYLPEALNATVAALGPGERTPLFLTTTSWTRYSCYLQLPAPQTHPWAGVVRLEVPALLKLRGAQNLVDVAAASLPRYASVSFKDPRAPQNLFPIGGLERELRRRLGDTALVQRALRRAAAALGSEAASRTEGEKPGAEK